MKGRRAAPRCVACTLGVVGAALTLAACGSGGTDTREAVHGSAMAQTIPAQIDPRPHGFASTDQVRPVRNAWRVSSAQNLTEVDAGATAGDRTVGALVIFRHDFSNADQDVNLVKVVGSGPLRITGAPRGAKAEGSGQQNGVIDFVGQAGVSGTLHLSDDSVTLNPPR